MITIQTFLPLPDFAESARVLDLRRLGNQRVEVVQILNIIHEIDGKTGWANHPAVRMWRGHEPQLCEYGIVICDEWTARGYTDNACKDQIEQHLDWATSGDFSMAKPTWFGDPDFHLAHQSNLIRKNPTHYGRLWPGVRDDLEYIWPVP